MDGSTRKAKARTILRAQTADKKGPAKTENPLPYYVSRKRSPVIIASECPAVESQCGLSIPLPRMIFVITLLMMICFTLPMYASGTAVESGLNPAIATTPVVEAAGPMAPDTQKLPTQVVATSRPSIENRPIRVHAPHSEISSAESQENVSKPSGESTLGSISVQIFCALAAVIGLILLGRSLARKFIPGAATGSGKGVVEILARHPLSRQQSIVLVRIGSQIVALNQTKESSQSVLVISDQQEVANILGQIQGLKSTSIQQQFNGYLKTAERELEAGEDPDLFEAAKAIEGHDLESQLDEMTAARRQLMELRQQVHSVRETLKN